MFSFFKKNTVNEVPEWASFFDIKQYNAFVKAIDRYLSKRNISYQIGDGILETEPQMFGNKQLGLVNVAQVCKLNNTEFNEIVEEHFENLAKGFQFDTEFKNNIDNYEKVKDYLGVRIYPLSYPQTVGIENTMGKVMADDLYATLIFDTPFSVSTIKPQQAEKWGETDDDLFTWGVTNMKRKYPIEVIQQSFGGFDIWIASADHFYSANIILDHTQMEELSGPHGSLVGIPHRHAALIYPIKNLKVTEAVSPIIQTVNGMYNEGPGSISTGLYWYKNKDLTEIPYNIEEGKLQIIPPDAFVEMLNDLAE